MQRVIAFPKKTCVDAARPRVPSDAFVREATGGLGLPALAAIGTVDPEPLTSTAEDAVGRTAMYAAAHLT